MPYITYTPKRFNPKSEALINLCESIAAEYSRQGYDLTLRQMYYQLVSRDVIPNSLKSYKNLGSLVNDARLAGRIDWDHIVDRTRFLRSLSTWDAPSDIIRSAMHSFRQDLWAKQKTRVEVWIEKDALVGVFEGVCNQLRVPLLSCRGYTSQSEMWGAAQRLGTHLETHDVLILHFGDHDPSGIDMSRDIEARLKLFLEGDGHFNSGQDADEGFSAHDTTFTVNRIALNMDQVEQYRPPPNPAKIGDSRSRQYIRRFGRESWELDALTPQVLTTLVTTEVQAVRDDDIWETSVAEETKQRQLLEKVSQQWNTVTTKLT